MWSATPSRELSIPPTSPQKLLCINMKRPGPETHALRAREYVSVFRNGPAIEACCVLLPHRENYAIGCGASLIVVYGRSTRESHWQSGHWSLEGLCLGFGSIELKRESIFSSLSVSVPQAQLCLTLHGAPCHAAQMKAKHSADGLIRLQQWACSFDACFPSLYLGREARWHYRPLQAHLKIIACMIAIFLTSLRRCSLCLEINGCSILDKGKAVSFHVPAKRMYF